MKDKLGSQSVSKLVTIWQLVGVSRSVEVDNVQVAKNCEKKTKMNLHQTKRNKCSFLAGVILVTIGLLILFFGNSVYDLVISSGLKVTPNSKAFEGWATAGPLRVNIYLFNWTNPEEILNKNSKPKFEQVGPFAFKNIIERVNVTWNDNDTITYANKKTYYFDEENSVGSLSDVVTTLNIVSLGIAHYARYWNYFSKKSLSLTLSMLANLHVTKTAGELLFDGYNDGLLSTLGMVPGVSVQDKFGLFYGRNATVEDGIYNMWAKTDENFGKVMSWNGVQHTSFYEDSCGEIVGSSGGFFPLNTNKERISIFDAELCKTAHLLYEKQVIVKGVAGYKFNGNNIFDNGSALPENWCYCNRECIPNGVLNVSSCRAGSPTFLSLPHFYNADPYYLDMVEGLKPEKDKHEFYFVLEPKSSVVLDVAARMQLNMLLQPIDSIFLYQDVPTVFFPVMYYEQLVSIADEHALALKLLQYIPYVINGVSLALIALGSSIILCLSILILSSKNYDIKNHVSSHIPEEDPLQPNHK